LDEFTAIDPPFSEDLERVLYPSHSLVIRHSAAAIDAVEDAREIEQFAARFQEVAIENGQGGLRFKFHG
jgi:hypothetical protein